MEKLIKEWKNLRLTSKDIHINLREFLVQNMVANHYEIEKICFPIVIKNEVVQFTQYVLTSNGSGDDYFLVIVNGKYQFFKYAYESDCDGPYYYGHLVSLTDVLSYIEDFKVNICHEKDVYQMLIKIK